MFHRALDLRNTLKQPGFSFSFCMHLGRAMANGFQQGWLGWPYEWEYPSSLKLQKKHDSGSPVALLDPKSCVHPLH